MQLISVLNATVIATWIFIPCGYKSCCCTFSLPLDVSTDPEKYCCKTPGQWKNPDRTLLPRVHNNKPNVKDLLLVCRLLK